MATISNENVAVNDRVYDLTQGWGIVIDTTFNEITVRFENGLRVMFDSTGHYNGVRRLYWANPVVVDPPKSSNLWATLTECIKSVHAHLYRR